MAQMTLEEALKLAESHRAAGREAQAVEVFRAILQVDPGNAIAGFWLGALTLRAGDAAGAVPLLERAIVRSPRWPECHTRLGFALLGVRRVADAQTSFERAIAIQPDYAPAHYALSWALLAQGHFERGWIEHEWRDRCLSLPGRVRKFPQPKWDGQPLEGNTILLYQEQGLGDVLQYVRYAKLVAERGGRVLLGCSTDLGDLLRRSPGVAEIAPNPDALPAFDVHLSLHSLPLIFGTTPTTIPADVPYVHADPAIVERWRARFDLKPGSKRVGVCWAGNPKHENDRQRSIAIEFLATLTSAANVQFFSLQKGLTIEQSRHLPPDLVDLAADLTSLSETAGAIAALDVVISVDTSIAHLAGAMGKPAWTLLPFHADWRWMLDRDDSPWYPTMQLFRQPAAHDWASVLRRVAHELEAREVGT